MRRDFPPEASLVNRSRFYFQNKFSACKYVFYQTMLRLFKITSVSSSFFSILELDWLAIKFLWRLLNKSCIWICVFVLYHVEKFDSLCSSCAFTCPQQLLDIFSKFSTMVLLPEYHHGLFSLPTISSTIRLTSTSETKFSVVFHLKPALSHACVDYTTICTGFRMKHS